MVNRWNSWRLAVRMARRDLKRHKGRSFLASMLIFLPVFVLAGGLSAATTFNISFAERNAPRLAGVHNVVYFDHDAPAKAAMPASGKKHDRRHQPTAAELSQQLGGTPVTVSVSSMLMLPQDRWANPLKESLAETLLTDLSSPINQGKFTLISGRLPKRPNERVVTDLGTALGLPQTGRPPRGVTANDVEIVGKVRTALPGVAMVGDFDATRVVTESATASVAFAVGGPTPLNGNQIAQLKSYGADVQSAEEIAAADAYGSNTPTLRMVAVPLTIATMSFVMVVALLAGPAFAASATRQRRSLGLLASNGATRATLRTVVLAQALLLGALTGLVAAVTGTLAGAAVAYYVRMRYSGFAPPIEIHWAWPLAVTVVAAGASVISAYFPARAAGKTNLLQALRGRVSVRTVRKRVPAVGLLGIVLGSALLWLAVEVGRGTGGSPNSSLATLSICVGTPLFFGGAVLTVPYILRALGNLAGFLPLTARLAVRDVSRQRTRATAAVGAVLATVAVLTGGAICASSVDAHEATQYQSALPPGSAALVYLDTPSRSAAHAREALPDFKRIASSAMAYWTAGTVDRPQFRATCPKQIKKADPTGISVVGVADDDLNRLKLSSREANLLAAGGALVVGSGKAVYPDAIPWANGSPDTPQIRRGKLTLGRQEWDTTSNTLARCTPTTLPAAEVPHSRVSQVAGLGSGVVVMKLSTLQRHASQVSLAGVWIPASEHINAQKERELKAVAGSSFYLTVERGYQSPVRMVIYGFTFIFAIIVVLTTAVATLLSDAESQSDAATLAVVGAPTGMRRRVVGAQAAATSAIGAAIGIVIGMIPGLTLARAFTGARYDERANRMIAVSGTYSVPWLALGAMLVLVPLITAAISMLFARRRPPLTRREA